MNIIILDILDNYINDVENNYKKYNLEKNKIKKEKILKDFMSDIICFLDHTVTEFPTNTKKINLSYFPRDHFLKNLKDYKKSLKFNNITKKLSNFLLLSYNIINKYNNWISYISWWFKYKNYLN